MNTLSFFSWSRSRAGHLPFRLGLLLLAFTLVAPHAATAQTPAWQTALTNAQLAAGTAIVRATAVNAAGDVFVTGTFTGQTGFGSTVLTSAGGNDVFVAKWATATQTWAWATAGGGFGNDQGLGIAVNGTSVYVTGYFTNNNTNGNSVTFGGTPLNGMSSAAAQDVFVAKYTDAGTSATFGWATADGGTGNDVGNGIAVSGTSVYVTGSFINTTANIMSVTFGGTLLNGVSTAAVQDVFVAKYTDAGTSATFGWATADGGTNNDQGYGIAVSGTSVYVTGVFTTTTTNANSVTFGGTPLNGMGSTASNDVFVAKYTDAGTSATFGWAKADGGTGADQGNGIAVSGTSVYVTGAFINTTTNGNSVTFGGTTLNGMGSSASLDAFVAKYTDAGTSATFGWATAGGGTSNDRGLGIAVSGTSVYVTGAFNNGKFNDNSATFGGTILNGVYISVTFDAFVAKYTDAGTSATFGWAKAGGGTGSDQGNAIAVSGTNVYTGVQMASSVTSLTFDGTTVGLEGNALASTATMAQLATATGAFQTMIGSAPTGGTAIVRATAVNAAGDVFVTGSFSGGVEFGSTTLVSTGNDDVFLAKWNPTSQSWAWATAGGGTAADAGLGIAVSGTSVYVTGSFITNIGNVQNVSFGGTPLNGMMSNSSQDVFVAKYTDAGTSATFGWATVGGGSGDDQGNGIAVNGTSVYVTGYFTNTTTNGNSVTFGGTPLNGMGSPASKDVFVAKYTDAGTSATFGWATADGGTGNDQGNGIAVSGTSVYVTGAFINNTANAGSVTFGGTLLNGVSTTAVQDVFVAKYTDAGTSATFGWATAGGGTSSDQGYGIAVSGTSVYVTGSFTNSTTNANSVTFGGTPLNGMGSPASTDVFVAKYTDAGNSATFGWATADGGTSSDQGLGIAVSGTSVYVTGTFNNAATNRNLVTFGGTRLNGASPSRTNDVFVAKYTDAGTSATFGWATAGGGSQTDQGNGIAVRGTNVYVGGQTARAATFGSQTLASTGSTSTFGLVAHVVEIPAPTLTALSPTSGPVGTVVTLTGTGFTSTSTVRFNGRAAAVTFTSATSLTATVPVGATTGDVTVNNSGGTAGGTSNGVNFTLITNATPTALALSNNTVAENSGANAVVGSLSTTDPDAADTHTYTLVSGVGSTDNALVNLNGAELRFTADPDYETKSSYSVRIRTTDNGAGNLYFEQAFTLTVTDVAEALTVSATQAVPAGLYTTLTVTGTGAATLTGPVTVETALLVQAGGSLTTACQPITGAGSFTLAAGATLAVCDPAGLTLTGSTGAVQLTGSRTFAPEATYRYVGTTAQVTGDGLPATVRELEISNSAGVTLSQATALTDVLRLTSGTLTTNAQPLTLLSNATRTAYAVHTGGTTTGDVTVQRYVGGPTAVGYRHLSSPVAAAPVSDLATTGFTPKVNPAYNNLPYVAPPAAQFPNVLGFNETRGGAIADFNTGYYSPTALTSPLTPGRGWSVAMAGAKTPDFVGALTTGTVAMSGLTRTGAFLGSGQKSGWHLLGNPYPQPIDWDLATVPTGMDAGIFVYRTSGGNAGTYLTRANGIGTLPDGVLALGQAFWARVTGTGPVSFSFTDALRVEANPTTVARPAADARPVLSLVLAQAGAAGWPSDETFVYAEAGATPAADSHFDALRPGRNTGAPTLASLIGADEAAINGLPTNALTGNAATTVELVAVLPAPGAYTLRVGQWQHWTGTPVELLDRLTGTRYDLAQQPVLTLTATRADEEVRGRFALVLNGQRVLGTASEVTAASPLMLAPNPAAVGGSVLVTGCSVSSPVTVFDLSGRRVGTATADATGTATLRTPELAAGVYVVRTTDGRTARLVVE